MNKLLLIYGMLSLGASPHLEGQNDQMGDAHLSQAQSTLVETTYKVDQAVINEVPRSYPKLMDISCDIEIEEAVDLSQINFVEIEDSIEVLDQNLPESFDAYETVVDMSTINFVDMEEEFELGFDTQAYLPEGFDAFENPTEVLDADGLTIDWNSKNYLPEGFDAHAAPVVLDHIDFIEEDEVDLGFDTAAYLPANFNPYIKVGKVESEDSLGFETKAFLPEGFDPYTDVVAINTINFMEIEDDGIEMPQSPAIAIGK